MFSYSNSYNPYIPAGGAYNRFQNPYDIPFVNGRSSAESYTMPPNSKIILMDQSLPRFYLKQTDASGCFTISTYEFKEVKEEVNVSTGEFVSRQEFEELKAMIRESYSKQNEPSVQQSTTTAAPAQF